MRQQRARRARSTYLFNISGAKDGLAQVFNVPGNNHVIYQASRSAVEADRRALQQDWYAVGDDLREAYVQVSHERG